MALGAFLSVSQAFPRRYPRSQRMCSLLEDSSVERQCTTECTAAHYVLSPHATVQGPLSSIYARRRE